MTPLKNYIIFEIQNWNIETDGVYSKLAEPWNIEQYAQYKYRMKNWEKAIVQILSKEVKFWRINIWYGLTL